MKRSIGALITLLVFCLAAVGLANAASLNLATPQVSTASAADRCTATAKAAPGVITAGTTKSVVLSGLDPKCANKKVSITPYNAQGVALATVKEKSLGQIAGGEATVTLPKAVNVASTEGAALTIGTWGIATTFTKPMPLLSCTIEGRPGVACKVTYSTDAWSNGFGLNNVVLSTTPVTVGAKWKITVNLADPLIPQPVAHLRSDLKLVDGMTCTSLPILEFVGYTEANKVTDKYGKTENFYIGGATTDRGEGTGVRLRCP